MTLAWKLAAKGLRCAVRVTGATDVVEHGRSARGGCGIDALGLGCRVRRVLRVMHRRRRIVRLDRYRFRRSRIHGFDRARRRIDRDRRGVSDLARRRGPAA